ncbi:hypothetical protein CK203_049592 [Vitis vinifera]|uniref:Uncharacterized protein n=1 Tax=Vitis vinifera TaxID=29760 RepID=A0A438FZG9_VITVI|nr:hypothetical protein CK203_049592 [Vitis vinifera]
MAGNDWLNSYLEAIIDAGPNLGDAKSSLLLRSAAISVPLATSSKRPLQRGVHRKGIPDWKICVGGFGIWLERRSR